MTNVTFDDFNEQGLIETRNIRPIFIHNIDAAVNGDVEERKKIHKWLIDDFNNKLIASANRMRKYRENVALYKGIHYRSQDTRSQMFRTQEGDNSIRQPKVVFNWIYDMVENRLAKLSRYKPAITFLPNNDEYHDKINAKIAKILVDSRWYDIDIDYIMREFTRTALIYGEAYLKVFWNRSIGDPIPEVKKLIDIGAVTPEMLKSGKFMIDKEGKRISVAEDFRIGDVDYAIIPPSEIFPELVNDWSKVTNITEIEYINVERLRAMYPEKSKDIREYRGLKFDPESLQDRNAGSDSLLVTFYAKPDRFLPFGFYAKFTEDVLLEASYYPEEFCDDFPFVRFTDIDITRELHGRSFIQVIKQAQMHYNNLASGIARNHGLASAPKWIVPKGSCKLTSLGNDAVVIEYAGPVPPSLVQLNPTPAEVFNYMEILKDNIGRLSGVHGISHGELPTGIEAAVSIERLDEQEAERNNTSIIKRISAIKQLALKTLRMQAKMYKDDDGRMFKILGKDNGYMIKSFKLSEFKTPNDVRVQNTSALPESKALRVSSLIRLSQAFPGVFSPARVIDMLDLGAVEAFKDRATVAVKAAESENEAILNGEFVEEPKPWEDLSVHYETHMTALQERQFKEQAPTDVREKLIEHIKVTEYLIWQKARQNTVFRQKFITMFPQYPVFFALDEDSAVYLATGQMPVSTVENNVGDLSAIDNEKINVEPLPGEEAKTRNVYIQT